MVSAYSKYERLQTYSSGIEVIQTKICGYEQIIAIGALYIHISGVDIVYEELTRMGSLLNAVSNIGRVFTAYINSNGDPNSRPLYLRHSANRNQHIHVQLQKEELVREEIAREEDEILEGLHEGQEAQDKELQ
ncbi:hypothetical protein BDC45DRAFT_561472 [Circinella umbellata]|nr:hypothetical protein BDC45DRAFT_561472 [Circinella umbellata]